MKRSSIRAVDRQHQKWPAGLLLSAPRAGDIDRPLRAPAEAPALSSKRGQRHVDSSRRRLNTNLFSFSL